MQLTYEGEIVGAPTGFALTEYANVADEMCAAAICRIEFAYIFLPTESKNRALQ